MYNNEDEYVEELNFLFKDAAELVKELNLTIEELFYELMHNYLEDINTLIMLKNKDIKWN